MTGGGFGGCIVALVQTEKADAVVKHIVDSYLAKDGKVRCC